MKEIPVRASPHLLGQNSTPKYFWGPFKNFWVPKFSTQSRILNLYKFSSIFQENTGHQKRFGGPKCLF